MLAIRLDEQLSSRLEALAKKTGRTKSWYARKAIEDYLDDMEDAALAAAAYEEDLLDNRESSSLADVRHRLGLDPTFRINPNDFMI
ncbi:type II toxin-antitoxin system RelB family antitoxin [Dethiosulfovibrio salsuginis]|uniref:Relaxosome protein TraY n=1 Tax=Dethiosulfovibrio salsuginis TaxID=561720 RepID=A0A1X7K0B1_9BACT|nr:ribbon-helix-helix domain-containing protein [Dethiosulfovibrio salsuginis]SMG34306.1 RHH-type transcriptional regulator, rel operon repressor / antitoxin RelB [Dethiosulfovibrio salsuginis]